MRSKPAIYPFTFYFFSWFESTTAEDCDSEPGPKTAPDGTAVPHSSISPSPSFCEGAGVDDMDGKGTVEAEGDSSGPRGAFRRVERLAGGSASE
jgi:hypothetical protein